MKHDTLSKVGRAKPRLLVCASDPGAAAHLCEFLHHAAFSGDVETIVLAGEPALAIFQRAGIDAHPAAVGRASESDTAAQAAILTSAAKLILKFRPDAIVVGLSGPDIGIDEALVAQAGTVPTFAVQDFWGDVNQGFGRLPDTYFVRDKMAADLTRVRAPAAMIIAVGSARNAATARLDPDRLRTEFRTAIGADYSTEVVVFLGQPLWHLPGYRATLSKAAAALQRVRPEALLLYRAHPKETLAERQESRNCLAKSTLSVNEDRALEVESSLCGADLLLTCFSSCGQDLVALSSISTKPLSALLCLLCETDIRDIYREMSALNDMPLSVMGATRTVWQDNDLEESIDKALTHSERNRAWLVARENTVDAVGTADRMLRAIVDKLVA